MYSIDIRKLVSPVFKITVKNGLKSKPLEFRTETVFIYKFEFVYIKKNI